MISINSPAKINLFLKIINKRRDGFHNIETAFQLINIFDYLSFQTTNSHGEIKFECSDVQLNTKSNIVFKVAKYLQSLTENPSGVVISLKKNIPVGAGLGGGSSNAASTLVALNEIWSLKLSREKLQKIGESFGSDNHSLSLEKMHMVLEKRNITKKRFYGEKLSNHLSKLSFVNAKNV